MHSLYEIETTVKRSSKARGLSWGISEEVGKAIRYLEQSNLAGLESFKRVIDRGFDSLTKLLEAEQKNTVNLCPVHFGLFFLDQSHRKDLLKKLDFENLIEPLISIPFLIKASKRNLIYFNLKSKELDLSISPENILLTNTRKLPHYISNFSLSLTTKRNGLYSQDTWDDLYKISLETFVEESEEKKLSGAGAGLTDND